MSMELKFGKVEVGADSVYRRFKTSRITVFETTSAMCPPNYQSVTFSIVNNKLHKRRS